MWMLRVLKGPHKGLLFPLSHGINTIGRSANCSIQIDVPGVSRKHMEIHVDDTSLRVVDRYSSNGTYINGVQAHDQVLESGDQVSMHHVVFDIIRNQFSQNLPMQQQPSIGNLAVDMNNPHPASDQQPDIAPNLHWTQKIQQYIEKIVLPGVYKLPEWLEFKWVIGLFTLSFIFLVVGFSALPMTYILKSSMEKESMSHAESIAESLAVENRPNLANNLQTALNVDYALRRPGVKKALIVRASDGRIIAPSERMHEYPQEPFIHKGRKTGKKITEKINSSTMGSMIPIELFNPNTGSHTVMAYTVVFYDTESLSIKNNKILSLLIQSIFIATLLGMLLFFFLYKIINFPIENINEQLSQALRDQSKDISTNYQFPALLQLCSNINSTLERVGSYQESDIQSSAPLDRNHEMSNLVELVGFPCLSIQIDTQSITAINSQFEEQTGVSQQKLLYQPLDSIEDIPLQLNLKEVVEKVSQNPSEIHVDQIEFNSHPFQVTAQGVYGSTELAYILVAFISEET